MAWGNISEELAADFEDAARKGQPRKPRPGDVVSSDDPDAELAARAERSRLRHRETVAEIRLRKRLAADFAIKRMCECGRLFLVGKGARGRPQTYCTPDCAHAARMRRYRANHPRDAYSVTTKVMSQDARTKGTPLPPELRAALRAAVARHGMCVVVERTGLSRNALVQAISGLCIYPGTAALVRAGLDFVDVGGPQTTAAGTLIPIPGKICA